MLEAAQRLGYAEADPTLDVSGMDAAHKIAILSSIAFTADLDFDKVSVSGVENIQLPDLVLADRLGLPTVPVVFGAGIRYTTTTTYV